MFGDDCWGLKAHRQSLVDHACSIVRFRGSSYNSQDLAAQQQDTIRIFPLCARGYGWTLLGSAGDVVRWLLGSRGAETKRNGRITLILSCWSTLSPKSAKMMVLCNCHSINRNEPGSWFRPLQGAQWVQKQPPEQKTACLGVQNSGLCSSYVMQLCKHGLKLENIPGDLI